MIPSALIPVIQREIQTFTQWQLESLDTIKEFMRSMGWDFEVIKKKVMVGDENGKPIKDAEGNPLIIEKNIPEITSLVDTPSINKECAQKVINSLLTLLNKNTYLANISKDQALDIVIDHCLTLIEDLAVNFDFYEIESISILYTIRSAVENIGTLALSRGIEGKTMDYLQPMIKLLEQLKPQQGGIL